MSRSAPVVTVDGPSGVGKGTVARRLARELSWQFLDSGALYRILALAAQARGVDLEDGAGVAALAPGIDIRFEESADGAERILIDGHDVAAAVRAETTGGLASIIAVHPPVRQALLDRQRAFRQPPGLVADGRDMGTVVFPDAPLKVFLEASADERAHRRFKQLSDLGQAANIDTLCAEIRARDVRDRNRSLAPLQPSADAVVIDTTGVDPDEVLSRVRDLAKARGLIL